MTQTMDAGIWMPTRRNLIGGLLALGAASALPRRAWALDADFPAVRAMMQGYIDAGQISGAVCAFGLDPAKPPLYVKAGAIAFGSKSAADENTLWRCYSMTKPVTGMAAMALIGEGKTSLDTPISEYLPAFARMMVQKSPDTLDGVPAKNPITIRHLLTHTAGFGYDIITTGPLQKAYIEQGITPAALSRTPPPGFERNTAPSLTEFADRLAKLPLIAEPGTLWSYSVSLDLLGRVIEVIEGKPFGDVLQQRFFDPLGMSDSGFQVPPEKAARLSSNYFLIGGKPVPIDPGPTSIFLDKPAFVFGGGGLVSSAHDYDRFLAMLANGGTLDGHQYIAPDATKLGMSNLLPPDAKTKGTLIDGEGFGAGARVSIHGPAAGNYGWGGAAGTVAWADPVRKLRGSGFAQYMPQDAIGFQREVGTAFVKDLLAAPAA